MLTLILGRGKTGKTTMLLNKVKDCPATGMAQRIVIVPDQLSHETERLLSQLCGDEISFVAEVLSFNRLANRVFSIYGGGARQCLDNAGRLLTANLALSAIRHDLKVFAPAAGRAEFLSSMVNMIDELKTYSVTPEMLINASKEATGMFAEKLRELALILGAYDAATAQGTLDPRDKMTLLYRKLRDGVYAKNRHFFVDGFTDFSQQDMNILRTLLEQSGNMTVTILCDGIESTDPLFNPGRDTARALIAMAESLHQEIKLLTAEHQRDIPGDLRYLEQNLFSYTSEKTKTKEQNIHINAASDLLQECRMCVSQLKKLSITGIRWRDMAVCTGNSAAYQSVMEMVCKSAGVPLYTTQKTVVTSNPALRFFLLGLEAAAEGMETETVAAYLKTGYSGLPDELCDAIENYAITWAVRGNKWSIPWMQHPEGYDGTFTDEIQTELKQLSLEKDGAISPLLHLSANLKSAGNVQTMVQQLHTFLVETNLYEKLSLEIESLTINGHLEEAQEMAQIYEVLLSCLEQTASVLGELKLSSRELHKVLQLALSQYEVGTIPAALDHVHFGDISSLRGKEPKILFVLGATEGDMPSVSAGGSLLTERERTLLEQAYHIQLAPDTEGALERQLLQIYSALTAPTKSLILSYPLEDGGEAKNPSYLLGRIRQLLAVYEATDLGPVFLTAEDAAQEYLLSVGDPDKAALMETVSRFATEEAALQAAIDGAYSAALPRDTTVEHDTAKTLFGLPVRLTASKLDALGNCPLSFFLDYGLRARKRKEATFDAAEFGTFVHHVLEKAVEELSHGDMSHEISKESAEELVGKYMEGYLEERTGGEISSRDAYLFNRNSQETTLLLQEISNEFSNSDFRPEGFELKFGRGGEMEPLKVDGFIGSGILEGMVDRLDRYSSEYGDFLRVVDYKSGTKKFDYTELYGGVGMQMLLYLFALQKVGNWGDTPAGVLYFPAKRPFTAADTPREEDAAVLTKRSGLVLGEELVLNAMEHGDVFRYLPVKQTKNGYGDYAISREQMNILKGFVEKRMGQAVDKILTGDFSPKPFYRGRSHDPCSWCDFKEVCQKDDKYKLKFYQETLKPREFWDKAGGEERGEHETD